MRPWSYERVELLETAPGSTGQPSWTWVQWSSQPEAPHERVLAMEALRDVVLAGDFPSLRGFSIWKLTTQSAHRDIEPFAVLLPIAPNTIDADARFLAAAAQVGAYLDDAPR